MGIKKRKYSQEFKEEIVQRALSGERILELGKENNISPGLINRWKRQYLDGGLSNNNNQEVKKLETQVAKLEQMIGKLTMENYILKKRKNTYYRGKKRVHPSLPVLIQIHQRRLQINGYKKIYLLL